MAFGARNDDGWRLCLRKGRTIKHTDIYGDRIEFRFKSQARAKACADVLNERFWKEYEKAERRDEIPACHYEMVETIRNFL